MNDAKRLWWQAGVIYQIYPLSFADANGDGYGDLRGIIERLDYLNDGTSDSLGVDAIWLSPIYASPMADFGYDVSDYEAIDPLFGTMDDFDELVTACHERGMRVIMDLVLNHTSDQHAWFVESRSSRDNPKRDWYIWRDGPTPGKPPNNWQSTFGGSAWTFDERTGQWYMHGFLPQQPDLNWRNPEVEAALLQVVRYWAERGVDGFRLDVVNHYFKDEAFRDNPRRGGLHIRPYERQQHIYDKDQPELLGALRRLRQVLDAYPERMSLGEVFSDDRTELAAELYGRGDDALHLAFNFDFANCAWDASQFQNVVQRWETLLPSGAWPIYALSNHDLVRHYTRYAKGDEADARARVAAAMLLTLRGTPCLYYGEEIGMAETRIPRSEILDPPGKRYWPFYRGRDGCRTPMQWSAEPQAGFTDGQPWLRVNGNYVERNVVRQAQDPHSLLHFYRRLIWLRKSLPALQWGELEWVQETPSEAISFLRRTPAQTLWVILNLAGKAVRLVPDNPLPSRHWQVLFSSCGRSGEETVGMSEVLAPYEVSILKAL